ncbi:PepSY domain-containing protein [Rheinheimera sp. 1928-s]|uniref:PepSY domain-containing protein n=1 Tax=Rheinheimera sp. 1928-s TaxID=3033803 RepID=UPI002631F78B|nr:PepSY domain-containing protein [Rheinheimera sp. 1928-s]MDF3126436.1 PepSY domain-containing protein [Rheinheimera sp. 1928-s]
MSLPRRVHRFLGWCLILPFFIWAVTGLIFFIKPGYQAAFSYLTIKTYPISSAVQINPQPDWQEVKLLQSVLGVHLLVKQADGWQQLNPQDFTVRSLPEEDELQLLIKDAISVDPQRYGQQLQKTDQGFITDTDVQIQLDWHSLSVSQQGKDTELINNLYKAHYLQWTGYKSLDQVVGVMGLVLLMLTTVLGIRLLIRRR